MNTISAVFVILTSAAFLVAFWKMKQAEKEPPRRRTRDGAGER